MSTMATSPMSILVHDQGTPCSPLSVPISCCDGATSVAAEVRNEQKVFPGSLHEVAQKHESVETSQNSYLNKLRSRTQPLPVETPRNLNRESVKVVNATSLFDPVSNHSNQNSIPGMRCCQCRPTNKTCCHQKSCRCRSSKTPCRDCLNGEACKNEFNKTNTHLTQIPLAQNTRDTQNQDEQSPTEHTNITHLGRVSTEQCCHH
jgi:hypothetical protein